MNSETLSTLTRFQISTCIWIHFTSLKLIQMFLVSTERPTGRLQHHLAPHWNHACICIWSVYLFKFMANDPSLDVAPSSFGMIFYVLQLFYYKIIMISFVEWSCNSYKKGRPKLVWSLLSGKKGNHSSCLFRGKLKPDLLQQTLTPRQTKTIPIKTI